MTGCLYCFGFLFYFVSRFCCRIRGDVLIQVNEVSLLWAFHNCIRFAIHALKTSLSMKAGLRA